MSHFAVTLVTEQKPTSGELERIMQPYHEFESTGIDDKYVLDVDVSSEHVGDGDTIQFFEDDYGFAATTCPDMDRDHKYGYILVSPDGEFIKAIKRTNPKRKWDWWGIGGRFKEHWFDVSGRHTTQVQKSGIDFDAMERRAVWRAGGEYRAMMVITGGEKWISWEQCRNNHADNIGAARTEYNGQWQIKKMRFHDELRHLRHLDKLLMPRDEYLSDARKWSICTYAFLRNGEWHQRGDMGWWGMHDEEHDDWPEVYARLLAGVPNDHWLTIVDCHI